MAEDRNRYSGPNQNVAPRSSPYPTQRLAPPVSLVDTARAIEQASTQIAHQTHAQLDLINEQIKFLQAQARGILDKARHDLALHQAECRFTRVVGQCYHLYRRSNGSSYFSMLSPQDHGGDPPHEFLGSYWLEPDQTWTADGTPRQEPRELASARLPAALIGARPRSDAPDSAAGKEPSRPSSPDPTPNPDP